jgi:glutamate synthase domain-containing protein 2/rubredoxin
MAEYHCTTCGHVYDEQREGHDFHELDENWHCPVCFTEKGGFIKEDAEGGATSVGLPEQGEELAKETRKPWKRGSDALEPYMEDIHFIAGMGASVIEAMRTRRSVISWDDVLIKGAQLATIPLNEDVEVSTRTVIGPRAERPLVIETPILVTHMSFGALSREAKIVLARGSAAVKTAMSSGEGGILEESLKNSYRYIFEYVPNRYSVTEENLRRVDAIELKFGQGTKPGMGGHLPAEKVTAEIAAIRGLPEGVDIISPAHFEDINTREELESTVQWLRETSGGRPIGIKIAAGHVEQDLERALYGKPDFITIDGRSGATGASSKFVKDATSIPTVFALCRACRFFREQGVEGVSLIITGGFRISADFAKAIAIGADAVAIGTAALMAIGCQQYRICNTGNCPSGIATQDPELRSRLNIDEASEGLVNFLRVSTQELREFARLTGNRDIHDLGIEDLCTPNSEISNYTEIEHV